MAIVAVFFIRNWENYAIHRPKKKTPLGDDEHGWDNEGALILKAAIGAKTIDLSKNEPDILWCNKKRPTLENLSVNEEGEIDFHN
jgi:phosphoenolpyruvate carboxykinase (ATP)